MREFSFRLRLSGIQIAIQHETFVEILSVGETVCDGVSGGGDRSRPAAWTDPYTAVPPILGPCRPFWAAIAAKTGPELSLKRCGWRSSRRGLNRDVAGQRTTIRQIPPAARRPLDGV